MNNRHTLSTGLKRKLTLTGSMAALLLAANFGQAAVMVTLTDTVGTPNSGTGVVGQPFSINVRLISDLEQTTGLTYSLQELTGSAGNAHFQIIGRDVTGSPFSDLTSSDVAVLDPGSAVLDPSNGSDLGGGLVNLNAPLGPGNYFVASISLLVLPTTLPGNYLIELTPNSVAAGPNGGPNPFPEIQVQRFSYTVAAVNVPEPATAGLLILGGLFFGARTRFRKTH